MFNAMNSKPTTFYQVFNSSLFNNTIKAIEIPIVQRDYAQGRETKEVNRIRDQFVRAIEKALFDNEHIKLDFVYGNVEDGKLIPLDGQQRLTTLFLLHWYVAKQELVPIEEHEFLKWFTYRTRFSSQHFCERLVECTPDLSVEQISEWLRDQNWFMYSWEKDPTIKSMLVMLDKLHETFYGTTGIWEKLIKEEDAAISFYFLPLEEMGVSDSLYIKMNSRGKPLTPFEHFKADFEKTIKEVSKDLYREFTHKVDNDWVDTLWRYRGEDDVIDDEFMKFYRFVTEMICYELELEILENDFELANLVYGSSNDRAEDNLRLLFKSFDVWGQVGNLDHFFNSIFSHENYNSGKVVLYSDHTNLFSLCCQNYGDTSGKSRKFSLNNTILLFAIQLYLRHQNEISEADFSERLRIVRNLIFNSPDEIRESRLTALLSDTSQIITNGEVSLKTQGFSEIQKNQEIEKMEWRKANPYLVATLNQIEDHRLLQGNIAIIGTDDVDHFQLLTKNFIELFNRSYSFLPISRALLTVGDYSQLASWRYLLGNENDSTWRELFTQSKKRRFFERTKNVLLEFLQEKEVSITKHVSNLISQYLSQEQIQKDWKYYFIKYPEMRSGKSGIYYWYNDPSKIKGNQYEVYMMNTPHALNGRHWNPFLFVLSKDPELKGKVSLEEYGALLVLNESGQKLACMNNEWTFINSEGQIEHSIAIPQIENTDEVDRIELIKSYLINNLFKLAGDGRI